MSLSKYLLVGLGVTAVGAGVIWLSREQESFKYDPKVHTIAKLHDIMEDTYLEYACSYIFYYNMILNMKEQGGLTPAFLENVKPKILEYTKQRDEVVCKKHGITPDFLEKWIKKHPSDKKIQDIFKAISDLHDQVLVKHQITAFSFEIPHELSREIYLQIARKVQACTRHEAYNQVQALLKREAKDKVTDKEMDDILESIGNNKQEDFRLGALKLFGITLPEEETPKRLLQKAYLVFSTVSSIVTKPGEPPIRSRWSEQLQQEQKVHGEILNKIQNGERVDGIEKDPLATKEADIAYNYNMMPGFVRREASMSPGEDKLRVQPHQESLQKVQDLMNKIKNKRKAKKEAKEGELHEVEEEKEGTPAHHESQQDEVVIQEPSEELPVATIVQEAVAQVEEVKAEVNEVVAEKQVEEAKEGEPEQTEVVDKSMSAKVVQLKSFKVPLKDGVTYYYCTCGRSSSQPFCDGSHNEEGCSLKPLEFVYKSEGGVAEEVRGLCGCKHNKPESGAFCDGSHKTLDKKVGDW